MATRRKESATAEIKTRLKETLRAKLEKAAKRRGVSMNSELVDRLEQTFAADDMLAAAEDRAYPEHLAPIVTLIGDVMRGTGERAMTDALPSDLARSWLDDPYAYDQAVQAVMAVLEAFRPPGDPHRLRDGTDATQHGFRRDRGLIVAAGTMTVVKSGRFIFETPDGKRHTKPAAEEIRRRLGPELIERIQVPEWPTKDGGKQ
jgi:hypothetical protein